MKGKKPVSIPRSGLVATPDTIDEALDRAKSLLTQGANQKYKLKNVYVSDVLIALQLIQNTLSENYVVYEVDSSDTE